jgi:hypothetical protein
MTEKKIYGMEAIAPNHRKLTHIQAKRLGALAQIDAKELAGATLGSLSEKLQWQVDPTWFLFRRICGKVVKKDPITGVEHPVPFATVVVEDTDCNLVSYFPKDRKWGWFFPLFCHREVLTTTKTDKCGNFCAWVPRFDIDWILHWRKLRICFGVIFRRPTLRDLLGPLYERPFPPIPGPDPGPLAALSNVQAGTLEGLAGPGGRQLAKKLAELRSTRAFGTLDVQAKDLLDVRAFDGELPPPLPEEFRRVLAGQAHAAGESRAKPHDAIRSAVAMQLGVDREAVERFNPNQFVGPFLRCFDINIPEWQLVLDVPDITFKVTQDINGDGVEETIYSEGMFDVRWDAGDISNLKLVTSPLAIESHSCETPTVVCGNVPAILFAGMMSLTDPGYFDSSQGYATRPNRPINAMGRPSAQTPFLWTLQLFGCVNIPGAKFYRVQLSNNDGGSFSPITGLTWKIFHLPAGPWQTVQEDGSGWYPVLPNPEQFELGTMVLEWPTPLLGKYVLKIEIGDLGKNVTASSATVAIQVDGTAPTVTFDNLKWKFASEPESAFNLPGRDLTGPCPTIHRGATPQDVEVQFDATVSAHHLRDAYIYTAGCGGGSANLLPTPPSNTSHWHDSVTDNSVFLTGRYAIPSGDLEGAYTFGCRANSRAMNPSGGDGGHLADWFYDPIYVGAQPEIRVAIVNA